MSLRFWRRTRPVGSPVRLSRLTAARNSNAARVARSSTCQTAFLRRGETNMNSLKHNAVGADAMYVILGASGNTGSIIANSLLSKGRKVRVIGRDAGRLQSFA